MPFFTIRLFLIMPVLIDHMMLKEENSLCLRISSAVILYILYFSRIKKTKLKKTLGGGKALKPIE